MLVKDSYEDVETSSGTMRVYLFSPSIPDVPQAKFPGVVVFSEIYQVTAPVMRVCRLIASRGYLVACPSSYHEYEGTRAMDYSDADTALGNAYKVRKSLAAFDEDARLTIELLAARSSTGRVGATGICLGGHLAFRASFHPLVRACVTFFATDIHSASLGNVRPDDTLVRAADGDTNHAELLLIFGKRDNHVDRPGRDLIRRTLDDAGATFSWYEPANAAHAFVRDEASKGRYDAALTGVCLEMLFELFGRTIAVST